jgi:dihydrofolate reductase
MNNSKRYKPIVNLIAAYSNNNAIGIEGKIPWNIPEDLAYFKQLTKDNIIIMGRKTFESLPIKPLPFRINIVITSNPVKYDYEAENLFFVDSILAAYNKAIKMPIPKKIFIIGGQRVYEEAFRNFDIDMCYITKINTLIEKADTFFPIELMEKEFKLHKEIMNETDVNFKFQQWIPKKMY